MRRLARQTRFLILGLVALHIILWVAFYSGSGWAAELVRWLNKRTINPLMLRFAGRKGFYAAAIHHVGRSSGRRYATPVVAKSAGAGFVVPLPYGERVDWLKNIQAAGTALLSVDGSLLAVGKPKVITAAEAARFLPAGMKCLLDWQGVSAYLRLDPVDQEPKWPHNRTPA